MNDELKKLLLASGLLVGASIYGYYETHKPLKFDGVKNSEYAIGATPMDLNKDGRVDSWFIFYDMNKNGKEDVGAAYLIKDGVTQKNAYLMLEDFNEDGQPDKYYLDTDGNGTLDKIVKPEYKNLKRTRGKDI